MIGLRHRPRKRPRPAQVETDPGFDVLNLEEARALFDERARALVNMSGEEFLRRWDAGEFQPVPDDTEGRKIGMLVAMLPFARPTPA